MSNVAVGGCEPLLETLPSVPPAYRDRNLLWLPPVGVLAPFKGRLLEHRSTVRTENLAGYPRSQFTMRTCMCFRKPPRCLPVGLDVRKPLVFFGGAHAPSMEWRISSTNLL
jgi:hypothetical protein